MERVYDGFVKIDKFPVKKANGSEYMYEKVGIPSAVAAVVVNNDNKVLLVKQMRPCVGKETLEIPAGCIDKDGLTDEEIMIEELIEEGNISKDDIIQFEQIRKYHTVIGSSDANMVLYYVKVNVGSGIYGVDDSDVYEAMWVTLEEMKRYIDDGMITDGKSVMAYQHLKIKQLENK